MFPEYKSFAEIINVEYDRWKNSDEESVKKLEKIKASLTTSGRQLRLANDKTQGLSIKGLTRGNKTMKAEFDSVRQSMDNDDDEEASSAPLLQY